jgi:hypothetical protein
MLAGDFAGIFVEACRGVGFLVLSGIIFRTRALLNKPAWGGAVVPLLCVGLLFFVPGVIVAALTYTR